MIRYEGGKGTVYRYLSLRVPSEINCSSGERAQLAATVPESQLYLDVQDDKTLSRFR
jgi:hypothetical protein